MSSLAAVFAQLGSVVMPQVLDAVANGECRMLARASGSPTDSRGFPNPTFQARTEAFIPCVWKIRSANAPDADEEMVAGQVKGVLKYKITVPRVFAGSPVVVLTADRLELKQTVGGAVSATLEIVGPVNVSNVVWEVIAIDIDAP
jgi:hypothetical protein